MYFDSYITGKRIQQLRKTKGLTQEQFAVKLNISDRYLGKIERGEGTASIDLLVEVAISLNTTLDFLILGVLDEFKILAICSIKGLCVRLFFF